MSDPYKRALYQRNRRTVLEAAGYRCSIPGCARPATTADHITPLALGGSHDLANLRPMCARHNSLLGARLTNAIRAARAMGRRSRRW